MTTHAIRVRDLLGGPLLAVMLVTASCGSSDDTEAAEDGSNATASTSATTATSVTTTEAPTTTEATTTTVAETTTEAPVTEAPLEPVPAGTGLLTIGDDEYPFTVDKCSFEPSVVEGTSSVLLFEMRGTATAEGREVQVRALRIDTNSLVNDSFGYGYATDPDDFETLVSVGSVFGLGTFLRTDGSTMAGGPVPFDRTEGISVVDGVDPGQGTIVVTC